MAIVNHFGSVCIVTATITKAAMAMCLFIFVLKGNIYVLFDTRQLLTVDLIYMLIYPLKSLPHFLI